MKAPLPPCSPQSGRDPPLSAGGGSETLARWLDLLRRDPSAPDVIHERLAALLHDPGLARRVAEGLRRRAAAEAGGGAAAPREGPALGGRLAERLRDFLDGNDGGLALPPGPPLLRVPLLAGQSAAVPGGGRGAAALHAARLRGSAALCASEALAALIGR